MLTSDLIKEGNISSGQGEAQPWSTYILECGDGTLYCGVAIDVDQRMHDHRLKRGARYVRSHGGVKRLLWTKAFETRRIAQQVEHFLKRMPRAHKLAIAATGILPAWGNAR